MEAEETENSGMETALMRIERCRKAAFRKLDLSNLNLAELPEGLTALTGQAAYAVW